MTLHEGISKVGPVDAQGRELYPPPLPRVQQVRANIRQIVADAEAIIQLRDGVKEARPRSEAWPYPAYVMTDNEIIVTSPVLSRIEGGVRNPQLFILRSWMLKILVDAHKPKKPQAPKTMGEAGYL